MQDFVRVATIRPALPAVPSEMRRDYPWAKWTDKAPPITQVMVLDMSEVTSQSRYLFAHSYKSYRWDGSWVDWNPNFENGPPPLPNEVLCAIATRTVIALPTGWLSEGTLAVMVDAAIEQRHDRLNELAAEMVPIELMAIPIAIATSRARRLRKSASRAARRTNDEVAP
jgi:hypothetical protein